MATRTILGSICSRYVTLEPLAKSLTTALLPAKWDHHLWYQAFCNFLYVDDFLSFLEWMNSRKILCNEIHSLQFSSQFQFPPVTSDQLWCSIPFQGHLTTIPSMGRPIMCKSSVKWIKVENWLDVVATAPSQNMFCRLAAFCHRRHVGIIPIHNSSISKDYHF